MNRELIGKAVALLVSYRDYTDDCRIANVCGEIVEALKAELAKPEPTPVAWAAKSVWGDLEGLSFDKQPRFDIPLYALDEVTK
jgi:hypothetical protein